MFIIANLIIAVAKIIDLVVTLYIFVIIARVILSWIPSNSYSSIVRFVYDITEPALEKIRNVIPPLGGFDLSPLILIFTLYILEGFVVSTLNDFAMAMK